MRNRLIALAGALLLLFCTGGVLEWQRQKEPQYPMRRDLGIYFTNADAVVETIRAALRDRSRQITVSYRSHADNMDGIGGIVRELMTYALEETDSPEEGDYIFQQYGGYEFTYSYTLQDDLYCYEIVITPQYYTTAEQEAEVTARVQEILREFGFTRRTTDYEKIYAVYSYVTQNVRYDLVHRKHPNHHLRSTAYAALIQGQATCQGYAALVYRLLREAGVMTRIVTGTAGSGADAEAHAWNIVCIGGLYYNLDATWAQQSGTDDYFLRSDANFPAHERDAMYADAAFYAQYPMAETDYLKGEES